MTTSLWRRAGAEMVGTYALVLANCGALVVNAQTGVLTHVGITLTFGLVITVMIAAAGHLSDAHFNPAVTLAFALTRHFAWRELPVYMAGQLAGAIAGALTLYLLFGNTANLRATLPSGSAFQSFVLELLLSAIIMFVIISVALRSGCFVAVGGDCFASLAMTTCRSDFPGRHSSTRLLVYLSAVALRRPSAFQRACHQPAHEVAPEEDIDEQRRDGG